MCFTQFDFLSYGYHLVDKRKPRCGRLQNFKRSEKLINFLVNIHKTIIIPKIRQLNVPEDGSPCSVQSECTCTNISPLPLPNIQIYAHLKRLNRNTKSILWRKNNTVWCMQTDIILIFNSFLEIALIQIT